MRIESVGLGSAGEEGDRTTHGHLGLSTGLADNAINYFIISRSSE